MSDNQSNNCQSSASDKVIKVGSRKSELALIQTRFVISKLKDMHPEKQFEIVTMCTLGDKILDVPLPKIGEKSLFTKELETCLLDESIDFVVHSLKDLPTILPDGMAIGAVLQREDPRDALVIRKGLQATDIGSLAEGSIIGTSSLRRTAQLCKKYPHLIVESIRGNLNTRLKKLDELGKYSAVILATSGLSRMGWQHRINQVFDCEDVLYAVGQGALAVECRQSDKRILNLLKPLNDLETVLQIIAERSFLKTLGGGCSAPVAVSCSLNLQKNAYKIDLKGAVWSLDGQTELIDELKFEMEFDQKNKRFTCGGDLKSDEIEDYVKTCDSCPYRHKKQSKNIETKIFLKSNYIARSSKCPIDLPVGSDFMAKCPYLDLISEKNLSDTDYFQYYDDLNKIKCPFITKLVTKPKPKSKRIKLSNSKNSNEKLYCGLVLFEDEYFNIYEKAEELGVCVAKKLLEKGAHEIMNIAKEIVHSKT